MEKEIVKRLRALELKKGIEILSAVETGSRAWGFPSPDSDYDVRVIYKEPLDWHLSLKARKDTLNVEIVDDLDITGWEIKKVLNLLWKSNVALLERLQSPIVYIDGEKYSTHLLELAKECFSPIAVMYHYNSTAKKYTSICFENENVKLKSYCYALRTAVAGMWVREVGTIPPIVFSDMFDLIDAAVLVNIKEMIKVKASKSESFKGLRSKRIDEFLKCTIMDNEKVAGSLSSGNGKFDSLEEFYREIVKS